MIENRDSGDENDFITFYDVCPHCGILCAPHTSWRTPVVKQRVSIHAAFEPATPDPAEKGYSEMLECCGNTYCIVKDEALARALGENLQYKLDMRAFRNMTRDHR